jgi:hypothetical protein
VPLVAITQLPLDVTEGGQIRVDGDEPRRTARVAITALLVVSGLLAAACVPPPPTGQNWSFRGTSVTVNNSQDEVCVLLCVNSEDEPYLLQVAFRVRIGAPNSAQAWTVKGTAPQDVPVGATRTFTGGQNATVTFGNVKALDTADLLDSNNKMEVFGTYTWAAEEDILDTLSGAANDTASILKNTLNATLAQSSLPTDPNDLVDLIVDNIGDAFTLLLSNIIPTFGLADDTLGGAVYVGIGAKGGLGGLIDPILATTSFPSVPLLGDNLAPPKIVGGGFYSMTGERTFTRVFDGADGRHTWNLRAGPA